MRSSTSRPAGDASTSLPSIFSAASNWRRGPLASRSCGVCARCSSRVVEWQSTCSWTTTSATAPRASPRFLRFAKINAWAAMSSSTPAAAAAEPLAPMSPNSSCAAQHSPPTLRLLGMGLLVLLVLVVLFGWLMLATIGLAFGLLLRLLVDGLVGWAADMVVPGRLPGGWIGAVLAGLIGGFIGRMLFHALGIRDLGFGLFGIELIPAFVGAILVVVAAEIFTSRRSIA